MENEPFVPTEAQAKVEDFLKATPIFWGNDSIELNGVAWESETEGLCICPFIGLHTEVDALRDCRVYADRGVIYCLHASCERKRKALNRKLQKVLGIVYKADDAERRKSKSAYDQAKYLAANRHLFINRYLPTARQFAPIECSSAEFIEAMFRPDDVIWVGTKFDSGSESHRNHFRSVSAWCNDGISPRFELTLPNAFQPGSYSRSIENIRDLRYFVLESDSLGRDGTRAMAEMVIDKFKIKLKAVVFSGNHSDHLWFEHPGLEWLKPRAKLFEAMGFDPKVVRPHQTVRLAGAINCKTGGYQSLVWFDPD
jgi:hypothetical protein